MGNAAAMKFLKQMQTLGAENHYLHLFFGSLTVFENSYMQHMQQRVLDTLINEYENSLSF